MKIFKHIASIVQYEFFNKDIIEDFEKKEYDNDLIYSDLSENEEEENQDNNEDMDMNIEL